MSLLVKTICRRLATYYKYGYQRMLVTTDIEIDGTPFTFYDVSAQENNRKKWLHQFKNVEVILFVASLGDFNVISSQDPMRIKLDLALEMLKEVMETEEFKEKSTILLLNKFDAKGENGTEHRSIRNP